MDKAHQAIQFTYQQMAEKDNLDYSILRDVVARNYAIAKQREDILFSESGLLSVGLTALGFGSFTGILGLMRKRPSDITPEEMEAMLADIKGELSDKERLFLELVRGIQAFIDANGKDVPAVKDLKAKLSTAQSQDTKVAVAEAKTLLS